MWEEADPLLGLGLYIIVMGMIFILPTIIGLISGWLIIKFRKMWKTGVVVWSLILCSPVIFLISVDFIQRAIRNAWTTLYGYSWEYTFYVVGGMFPFVFPIWILGTLFLLNFTKKDKENLSPSKDMNKNQDPNAS